MTFQTEFGEFGNNFYELYARGKFWFFIVFASIFVGSPIKWVQHRTRTQQIIAHILFKYFLFILELVHLQNEVVYHIVVIGEEIVQFLKSSMLPTWSLHSEAC